MRSDVVRSALRAGDGYRTRVVSLGTVPAGRGAVHLWCARSRVACSHLVRPGAWPVCGPGRCSRSVAGRRSSTDVRRGRSPGFSVRRSRRASTRVGRRCCQGCCRTGGVRCFDRESCCRRLSAGGGGGAPRDQATTPCEAAPRRRPPHVPFFAFAAITEGPGVPRLSVRGARRCGDSGSGVVVPRRWRS
jgi:hypothetical protein